MLGFRIQTANRGLDVRGTDGRKFWPGSSGDQFGQRTGAGDRGGAAARQKSDLGNSVIDAGEGKAQLVSANRVFAGYPVSRRMQVPGVTRIREVIQQLWTVQCPSIFSDLRVLGIS